MIKLRSQLTQKELDFLYFLKRQAKRKKSGIVKKATNKRRPPYAPNYQNRRNTNGQRVQA
jgi:hypothetical protein